ncbi:MAG: DUF5703 family protein [Nocardioides sp.]
MGAPSLAVPATKLGRGVEWEFRTMSIPRDCSRSATTRLLVEQAELGGWELARVRIGNDGVRRVVLRRKIIRARSTLGMV